MKNLIFASLALFSSSLAMATDCPDYSGKYVLSNSDTVVNLVVTQIKCQSVTFSYTYPATGEAFGKIYPMDNVRRQTYEDADLIVYETSGVTGKELKNYVEDYYKASATTIIADSTFDMDASNNLTGADNYYDAKGNLESTDSHYFTRVK